MKEFIDKLIERLEEEINQALKDMAESKSNAGANFFSGTAGAFNTSIDIVNELAEEYKEERTLDCDKLLFAYSDLLRRFQYAEGTVICEFSGNISKETEELEAECEELLSQFKEILYSADSSKKSANGWIPCSERLPHEGIKVLCCINPSIAKHEIIIAPYEKHVNSWHNGNIIAWQPLPAHYTKGE